ncbi:hypothetical protein QE400_000039 [Xanthomonas sacchari]|uniref:hypothetical protein n=1 Tax=Xanthomonas sacchari TaxID=56458 RepID=UPI002781C22E|nr:hypothetical protein [Xanthomonas sacchari]MDQ1090626.1 hypothetical protein [Xanthomonas sacchari]
MANWIDLAEHGMVLLWRLKPGSAHARQLILQPLTDARVPSAIVELGFLPEGPQYVRDSSVLVPAEFLRVFPRGRLVDVPQDFFQTRVASNIVRLNGRGAPAAAPSLSGRYGSTDFGIMRWALTPLPRFLRDARTLIEDGSSIVAYGGIERLTKSRGTSIALKSNAHALAVRTARDAGAQLPFQVLVDYPEHIYFGGARRTHAAYLAGRLISRLAVAERLVGGARARVASSRPGQADLVLRIAQDHDRTELVFMQGSEISAGFSIARSRLHLAWTRQIQQRGFDPLLAALFMSSLLSGDYDAEGIQWDYPDCGDGRSTAAA